MQEQKVVYMLIDLFIGMVSAMLLGLAIAGVLTLSEYLKEKRNGKNNN